jgi:hypothetical protein
MLPIGIVSQQGAGLPVVDGLIIHLDASKTASYPGTGATWYDLSGAGNHFTLSGSPPFNPTLARGVFEFAGSASSYAQRTGPNMTSITHTISYVTRYGSGAKGRVLASGVSGGNWLGGYHGGTSGKYYANGWVYQTALGNETSWKHVTVTGRQSGDLWQLFNNGVPLHTANNSGSAGPNGLRIGGDATYPTEYSDCDCGWLVAYNRILSQAEITALHNYIKGRYGL